MNNLDEKEIPLTAADLLKLVGFWAYWDFEKVSRRKSRQMLNLVFNKAKERGYKDEVTLKELFKTTSGYSEKKDKAINELIRFVSPEEIIAFMDYI